jgi:hypothetical protein
MSILRIWRSIATECLRLHVHAHVYTTRGMSWVVLVLCRPTRHREDTAKREHRNLGGWLFLHLVGLAFSGTCHC